MVYIKYDYKYPEVKDQIYHGSDGKVYINKNASVEDIAKYKEMRNSLENQTRYYLLSKTEHSCDWYLKEMKYYHYGILKDISDYVMFKNRKIIEKQPVPDELKETFQNCKTVLEADWNYMIEEENTFFLNGKKYGIHTKYTFGCPVVILKLSDKFLGHTPYEAFLHNRYVSCFSKGIFHKSEWAFDYRIPDKYYYPD